MHLASIVEKVMTDMLMNIKGKLLSISSKVAPAVIASDNLGEIQDVIQDEIFEALEELSEYDPDIFKNNKIFVENEEDMEVKVESEKRIRGRPKKNS